MKQFLLFLFLIFSSSSISAQEFKWDVNAGYLHTNARFKVDYANLDIYTPDDPFLTGSFTDTETANGFYIGVGGQYRLESALALSGHVNYARYTESGFLQVPLALHYYIADSGFNIFAGPQFTYDIEDAAIYDSGDVTRLNIGAGGGVGYEFSNNLFLEARYTFQLNNFFQNETTATLRTNYLNIGLGYRF
ncbi:MULTISPECIES: porin family protein [unclassified Leeuwenhoekiella]|uniref:porin family protein n=1 Tax=unclassified Leeuwenhoekiella TaxID=2615029 RepID=UPI000C35072B|nr:MULTISPECIES: porin family protein [unclassified Leeuwenhoekiella]MAW95569.1 hypothetical protein [Leeuwenhoekiella sp.]MBA82339.1 hypothetical protein [Leeuwenhoekiella sp.]|tara:strand:- start:2704 stop:3276 length:573 start_codon:yes stop_codon:yes gene_type:complete